MRRLVEMGKVDPAVVLQAHKIVKGIDRNHWAKMAAAIFQFVHDKIAYVRDPVGVEFVKSPAITLKTKTGDCDDQSVLFSALAESIGMTTRFKAVKADPKYPSEFSHVYSQVKIPNKGWMTADTIVPYAKFGWEAKNFPSKTWGGANGLSYIDSSVAGMLGDALLAAGTVGYDEEIEMDGGSSFGDVFGGDDDAVPGELKFAGSMWDTLPLLTTDQAQINTGADAPPDFWGGSADTEAGPGFKSRMLPPGVGSLNGIPLSYGYDTMGNLCLGYYDGMGRWRPFKKLRKAISKPFKKLGSNISKSFKKAGGKIAKGWKKSVVKPLEKFGKQVAKGIGLSTPESRDKARRTAVEQALSTVWTGEGIQVGLSVLERAQDMILAVKEGRPPKWAKGPPPTMQGFIGEMARSPRSRVPMMEGYAAAIAAAAQLIKGIGAKRDAEAAEAALKSYVEKFPSDELNKAIEDASKAFIAAGGMMPSTGEPASQEWVSKWKADVNAKTANAQKTTGATYQYMMALMKDLKAAIPPLKAARSAFETAYKAHTKTEGAQTIQAAASVVKLAAEAGSIKPDEIKMALQITKKKAEGFKLTPQEQELAARIASGARAKQGAGKGVLVAVPAAAAVVATLLL
jgi:hypothetical protein